MRNADFNGSRHQDEEAAQQRLDQFQTRPDKGVKPPTQPDFGPLQPGPEGEICHLLPKGAKPCLYEPGIVLHGLEDRGGGSAVGKFVGATEELKQGTSDDICG